MKMQKRLIIYIALLTGVVLFLNIPVITKQGMGGSVYTKRIPFYVKLCAFLYRDYQYNDLSREITLGIKNDMDRVIAIYNWVTENIRRVPKDFPVIDDHIWNIIVRRYGCGDQQADVFTILVSYAGYEAFWDKLKIDGIDQQLVLSFVKIDNKWYMFDVYSNKSFVKPEDSTPYGPTYGEFLKTMDETHFRAYIKRPDKQKILPRLVYEFKKISTFSKKDKK